MSTKVKMKTKSGAKKRFKKTGSGRIKRGSANKNHMQEKKSTRMKRQARRLQDVNENDMKSVKRMLCEI
jgi:large subunit ribosomal protein L35